MAAKRTSRYKRFERRLRALLFYRGDRFECVFCDRGYSNPVRLVEDLGEEVFERHRLLPDETIYLSRTETGDHPTDPDITLSTSARTFLTK